MSGTVTEFGAGPAAATAVRALRHDDWPAVKRIYAAGIAGGDATFETETPFWEDLGRGASGRPPAGRRLRRGEVVGWAALSRVSTRECYAGVAEVSVYVAPGRRAWASAPRCSSAWCRRRAGRDLDAPGRDLPGERGEPRAPPPLRLSRRRRPRRDRPPERPLARRRPARAPVGGDPVIKVETVVIRERVETVIDAVEDATGHVGVTVVEAIGHGRERGITHEYRGRIFESRFLPKAVLDVHRRRRASPRPWSRRSRTPRAAATSRATASSGRPPSRTSRTTGPGAA